MNKCSVCGKQKAKVTHKNSALLPRTKLYYCDDDLDKEPRYIIILVGRQNPKLVKPYLDNHRYVGKDVTESDLS